MHFVLPPEMTMVAAALFEARQPCRDDDDAAGQGRLTRYTRAKHTLTRLECVTFNAIECTL